tara:strand:- start:5261 stop:6508 length:1248 start_codon:yes stop_codon:yes gene_type:complete
MKNKNVILIEGIYKKYTLGIISYRTLADDLTKRWKLFKNKRETGNLLEKKEIIALKNINIKIKKGEILGLIGSNGAGKSTLLKILSKITTPSKGVIKIKGRIASLLEVGTGFHLELTGEENIFLNGAILGMTKIEINNKLKDIIEFSGIEEYINTPVKRYSSGMRVRLAFSVAAHLEPEILLIDEVLAVGDADFQKKCLGKMKNISDSGRTIIFVSHNMSAIKSLCTRAIVMEKGEIVYDNTATNSVNFYLIGNSITYQKKNIWNFKDLPETKNHKIISIEIAPQKGDKITVNSGIIFKIECYNQLIKSPIYIGMSIYSNDGIMLTHSYEPLDSPHNIKKGFYKTNITLPNNILNKGQYYINVWYGISFSENLVTTKERISFEVLPGVNKTSSRDIPGILNPNFSFSTSMVEKNI